MPYPAQENYIQFLSQLLDEFEQTQADAPKGPGRPFVHKNRVLIGFFALMVIKGCTAFRAMRRYLELKPEEAEKLGISSLPSRWTLSRRFKSLYEVIQQFVQFIGQWASPLGEAFQAEAVFEEPSLFKAKGPIRHKKDIADNTVPKGLRNVDKDATWSKSKYRGWVFGYGVHVTVTADGFPLLVSADIASVSEHLVLGEKQASLLEKNIGYVVGDDGYTNFKRTKQWCFDGLLLVTPATRANGDDGKAYRRFMQQEPIAELSYKRKTAIEPVFDLVSRIIGTTTKDKQLPLQRKGNVAAFLALGVLWLQIAMLMNTIWGLDLRNITHLITLFL